MAYKCEFKFQLKQRVKIIPLDGCEGVVWRLFVTENGILVEVRYFQNGCVEFALLTEDELEIVHNFSKGD